MSNMRNPAALLVLSFALVMMFQIQPISIAMGETVAENQQPALMWKIENVDLEGRAGDMGLDANGFLHLIYGSVTENGALLKYAYRTDYGWNVEAIDSLGQYACPTILALDNYGLPHVVYAVYYDAKKILLKYARKIDNGWEFHILENGADWLSLYEYDISLDPQGSPHIVFFSDLPASPDRINMHTGWRTGGNFKK